MELDKDNKGRTHTPSRSWSYGKGVPMHANISTISPGLAWQRPTQTSIFSLPSHHLRYFPICLRLTSGAGIAQRAADFTLVQMRPWDHQDVGDLAQWAVIRSLAPHLLWGQRAALQRRAAWDVIGTRALSGTTFSLPHRPAENKQICSVIWKRD